MLLFLSLAITLFFVLLVYAVYRRRAQSQGNVHERLLGLTATGEEEKEGEEKKPRTLADIPFVERAVVPAIKNIEQRVEKLAPHEIHAMLERRIMLAGKQYVWRVSSLVCLWVLSMLVGLVLGFMIANNNHMEFIQRIMAMLLGLVMGGLMPFTILNIMIQRRQQAMAKQLPEVLDLLCVSVQAGLSFDGAMGKIVERMTGPLIDEAKKMLSDVRMGMTRYNALQGMAKRCDIQDVHLFVTAIVQAEKLGTSMGNTLAIQADNIRERRRQYAKAEALKAPVKIVFPLVLFIFPALFVVVLVPTLLTLMKSL